MGDEILDMHGDAGDEVTEGLKMTLAMAGEILKCKKNGDAARQTTFKMESNLRHHALIKN